MKKTHMGNDLVLHPALELRPLQRGSKALFGEVRLKRLRVVVHGGTRLCHRGGVSHPCY